MDWSAILIAGLSCLGTLCGTVYGISKNASLTTYKIDKLTAEVKEHNNFARRMPVVEEQIKVINHRIEDLEERK